MPVNSKLKVAFSCSPERVLPLLDPYNMAFPTVKCVIIDKKFMRWLNNRHSHSAETLKSNSPHIPCLGILFSLYFLILWLSCKPNQPVVQSRLYWQYLRDLRYSVEYTEYSSTGKCPEMIVEVISQHQLGYGDWTVHRQFPHIILSEDSADCRKREEHG